MRENSDNEDIEKRFTEVFHREMTKEERRYFYLSEDRQGVAKTDSDNDHRSFGPPATEEGEPHFLNSVLRIVERYVPSTGSDPH